MFTTFQGIMILLSYFVLIFGVTLLFTKRPDNRSAFIVADRKLGEWESALSIAATWIWAPALFIAAQKAYTEGVVGLFWFTVPNVLCLVLFAFFAAKIRDRFPRGFSISQFMRNRYGRPAHRAYLLQLVGLAICSTAVQLLAGGKVVALLTGLPFHVVVLALALIALSYSLYSGLKASVVTDNFQMVLIAFVAFTLTPWAVHQAGGWRLILQGLGGITGEYTSLFSAKGLDVFLAFGLSTTIGLLSGPFGDQSFWQRAFATEKKRVVGAFIKGAFIFATVPLLMSLLGFAAAGSGAVVKDSSMVNLHLILKHLPAWTLVPFVFMLLSGLLSTVDSNLCAVSSIVAGDFSHKTQEKAMREGRLSMILLSAGGALVAMIPGLQILYLFMFYGTLRATTLLPTIIATLREEALTGRGVLWGVVVAFAIGLPVFAIGNYLRITPMVWGGSLATILLSGGVALYVSQREAKAKE